VTRFDPKAAERRREVRLARLALLLDAYPGDWNLDGQLGELASGRLATIQKQLHVAEWWVSTRDSLPDCRRYFAEELDEGWIPVGVIDLDTGKPHPVSYRVHIRIGPFADPAAPTPKVPWEVHDVVL